MTLLEEIAPVEEFEAVARIGDGPYILVTVTEGGRTDLQFQGFTIDQVIDGLRELADLLTVEIADEAAA